MSLETSQSSGRFEQALVIGQLLVALGAMAFLFFAPPADSPVALYLVSEAPKQAIPRLLSQAGTQVLARGRLDGSHMVRGDRPALIEALLSNDVLALNAPAPGCGALPMGETA